MSASTHTPTANKQPPWLPSFGTRLWSGSNTSWT
nr:MAG TPA: hypothetical protein [Caudoviricetes sp.]